METEATGGQVNSFLRLQLKKEAINLNMRNQRKQEITMRMVSLQDTPELPSEVMALNSCW